MTNFQCVLYTAIKTDYPGLVSCRLIRTLYSADGSVILAEAGAELTGEQRVEIKAGQTSVFTVWTELDTSQGVRASLNALGTDAMGRSGTDAYIDNHCGQRFGGAVMLSFVKDALASAANLTKKLQGVTTSVTVSTMQKIWAADRLKIVLIFRPPAMCCRVRC